MGDADTTPMDYTDFMPPPPNIKLTCPAETPITTTTSRQAAQNKLRGRVRCSDRFGLFGRSVVGPLATIALLWLGLVWFGLGRNWVRCSDRFGLGATHNYVRSTRGGRDHSAGSESAAFGWWADHHSAKQ
jgi:hypothetical protein